MKWLLLPLLLAGVPLNAQIGATPEQCIGRYGKPERDAIKESGLLCFRKEPLCVIAHFHKGRCDVLSIFSSRSMMGLSEELSQQTIGELLRSEGGSEHWDAPPRFTINGVWRSPDRGCFAVYDTMRHRLAIMTHEAYVREKADLEVARKKNEVKACPSPAG